MRFHDLPDSVRPARPRDYDAIAAVVDSWWGRPILDSLPRLFLDHFHDTSLVVERRAAGTTDLRGFLIGFASPTQPLEAYIHFIGIAPSERGSGLGRRLYELFFAAARTAGRTAVSAVTAPVNHASIAFHAAMGFSVSEPVTGYNGPGHDLVTFRRSI
ncbi:MAG: GNAT family N-acetyltransferase [Kineosporiaceae bacterium]|nr:GNAT family N-acetyltransferase [Kineosporiaceae bacterium]